MFEPWLQSELTVAKLSSKHGATTPGVLQLGRKLVAMTTPVVGPTLTVAHDVDAQRGSAVLLE